jgi:uncharacterized protein
MQCPVCDEKLRAIERSGIEVDICPGCKGLWLDRGELEKLIALESGVVQPAHPAVTRCEEPRERQRAAGGERHNDGEAEDDDRDDQRQGLGQGQRKQRGSWLSNLLENFGGD